MNILVFFGGESCEHDISVITGEQLISKCDEYLYNVIPVYIDKSGDWYTGKKLKDIDVFNSENWNKLKGVTKCALLPNNNTLYINKRDKYIQGNQIDCAILCLHGLRGEDGTIASILEQSKIPYSSTSVLGSSVCMDKGVFKIVCKGLGVNCVDGFVVSKREFLSGNEKVLDNIQQLGYPIIAKPCRQGSSIGINVVNTSDELYNKLTESFAFDDKLLIEKFLQVDKEVNIALFKNKDNVVFSNTEEPVGNDVILSFGDKYLNNAGGFETIKRIVPADIDDKIYNQIIDISKRLYLELDLFGVVRFDFLISDGSLYINEINTIPGSMANYLFDKSKYNYMDLIEMMISSALFRSEQSKKVLKSLDTGVLKSGINGFKK